ncbi:TonB-dependent receptor [Fulvivirga sp. 29W222]|uniref:TonB-dependent receptor n=1 Tax=Fulvivirga marina TaxID=2494733 RepID=A0A937FZ03_9BACT|nr:TonB-dependent receptor [Fulvivirga marina]MBL6445511.1 TonB-dependent receptor [Fulvivirga marina]
MKKIYLFTLAMMVSWCVAAQEPDSAYFSMTLEELMNIEVTTASLQSESMLKTPVPMTVVTREMIDAIGARNIKEVLTTYVPGFTAVEDHNEMNVSMRGIYASAQQKILFMVNGHRLNSRAYSMSNPDYSISLDKIKQIEVVRGPGSSIYGNVSLTAVVNIITLKGSELDGTQVKVGGGSYGQQYISGVAGTGLGINKDILAWGYHYSADGEKRDIDAADDYSSNTTEDGVAYLGAVQGNYDIGIQATMGKFDFFFNTNKGKIQQPFSDGGGTGELYNKNDFDDIFGEEPGLGQEMRRVKVGYTSSLSKSIDLDVDLYGDNTKVMGHLIAAPIARVNSVVAWWDRDLGGIAQFTFHYPKGNVLVGTQVDWMNVYDSFLATSANGTGILDTFLDTAVPLMEEGEEIIYSGFTQWKHNLANNLLVNAGFRYDNKNRHEGKNVDALSPRVALIYEASSSHNVRLSYSKSFVDAPYWYRYNSLASYSGSRDLLPENLQTLQLTLDSRLFSSTVYNSTNIFYQSLTDFIYRDPEAGAADPKYRNAGSMTSWGIEEQVRTKIGNLDILANATYQHAIDATDYEVDDAEIANVPSLTANVIGTYHFSNKVFFNLGLRYVSSQYSPITALGTDSSVPDNYVDAAFIVNAGLNAKFNDLMVDLRVKNIADTEYYQGGSTRFAYPQEGRWITASLQYTFKNN